MIDENGSKNIRIIQYLGSKLNILTDIEREIDFLMPPGGTLIDLFAGTGVVSNALKHKYHIISNDIQEYSYLMNCLLLKANRSELTKVCNIQQLFDNSDFKNNFSILSEIFSEPLRLEKEAIRNRNITTLIALNEANYFYDLSAMSSADAMVVEAYSSVKKYFTQGNIQKYRNDNTKFPYMLFTLYYQNSYFGLEQCITIDSLRFAIDRLSEQYYSDDLQKQVMLVCLLYAISDIVSSVGKHFAQPIKLRDQSGKEKPFSINRYLRDRDKSIQGAMEKMYQTIQCNLGNPAYKNEVYNLNYRELISKLDPAVTKVAYLDPPYTIDHYSRFYHIPETLIKYDYPIMESKKYGDRAILMHGRYRSDRFQSEFCISSKAKQEFDFMLNNLSKMNCLVVLSYSMANREKETRKRVIEIEDIISIANKYYSQVQIKNVFHKYRKLNARDRNREVLDDSEVLIICK